MTWRLRSKVTLPEGLAIFAGLSQIYALLFGGIGWVDYRRDLRAAHSTTIDSRITKVWKEKSGYQGVVEFTKVVRGKPTLCRTPISLQGVSFAVGATVRIVPREGSCGDVLVPGGQQTSQFLKLASGLLATGVVLAGGALATRGFRRRQPV